MFGKAASRIAKVVGDAAPTPSSGSSTFRNRLAARNQLAGNNVAQAINMSKSGNMAGASNALRKEVGLKKGGKVGSASKRADGIAKKGKTKGTFV